MTLFRWFVLAASLVFAGSSYAQQKDKAASDAPKETADRAAEKPAEPKPVIEISRSSKPNCDVKPVMTDEEIARCKKAWSASR
jgi:hypothetical protein